MGNPNTAPQPAPAAVEAPGKQFHKHTEMVSHEAAVDYAQAAVNVGDIAIKALKNPGETARLANGKRTVVPEGRMQIAVSGTVGPDGTKHFYDEVSRIRAAKDEKAA